MATKKPTTFNSDQAKTKWDSLESKAGASIQKIVSGTASSSDIKAISGTLTQLSNVASLVFEEAVTSAEKNALMIQKAGNIKVKEGLTAFETALNMSLQSSFSNLIQQIKDILELDLLGQTEELKTTMGGRFDEIAMMLPPKDLPTVNDLLASNELLVEKLQEASANDWDRRSDDLLDRIYSMFGEKLSNLKVKVPTVIGGSGSKHTKGQRHVMNPYELRNLAEQGAALTGPGDENTIEGGITEVEPTTDPLAQVSMPKGGGTVDATTTESATTSTGNQSNAQLDEITRKINQLIASKGKTKKGEENEDDQEKETKKADSWWKSFKNWIGHPLKNTKKAVGGFLDDHPWLKGLGLGLLSMILDPTLWTTLVDKFKEYVTWDNIKSTALSAWDSITSLADKYLTWDNVKAVASTAWDWIKTIGTDIYSWIQEAIHGKSPTVNKGVDVAKKDWNKPATDKHAQGVGPVSVGYAAGDATRQWVIDKYTQASGAVSNWFKGGDQTTSSPTISLNQNRNSSLSQQVGNITASQTAIRQGSMTVTPGTTTTNNVQTPAQASGTQGRQSAAGTPNISMNSFGFTSATNDQLMLMNVPGFMGS